ncbi:hypothetical protein V6N11_083136 [Hibiscus sabdariffa]|uniref:Reverse transcriptase zinc-binding domain-containing protein n=1 Tax=Hibiscus sabdariffa TaxID=183260 RepID=A0ABR2QKY2_9ROSI
MPGSSPSAEGQSTNMKVCSLVRPSADTPTVPKRRRRNGSFRKDFDYANTYNGRFVESDSRFATLANVSDSIGHEDESTPRTHNWVRVGYISDASGVDGVAQNSEGSSLLEGQLVVKSRKDIEGNTVAWEVPVRVASQGRVVAAKSSLNAEKNVVVQTRILPLLLLEVRDHIATVQPPKVWLGVDTPEWRWTDTRHFTTSSAYSFLSDTDSNSTITLWKKVWALLIPQRVKSFVWITLYNHMDHILCHCVTARGLWARVIHPELLVEFLHISFDVWLQCNLTSTYGSTYGDRWDSWFAIYCWLLWKDRCSVVLDSDHVPREDVLARGDRLVSECVSVLSSRLRNPTFDFIQPPQWSQPALGWVKGSTAEDLGAGHAEAARVDDLGLSSVVIYVGSGISDGIKGSGALKQRMPITCVIDGGQHSSGEHKPAQLRALKQRMPITCVVHVWFS